MWKRIKNMSLTKGSVSAGSTVGDSTSADTPEACKLCQSLIAPETTKAMSAHANGCATGALLEAFEKKTGWAGGGAVRFEGREFYLPAQENPQKGSSRHGHGYLSDIYPNSGAEDCFDMIRKWVKKCDAEHGGTECMSGVPVRLPKRVIDVRPENGKGDDVRLYESSEDENGTYITLSHCWGKDPILMTTIESLPAFRNNIIWERIPKTFQDAMTVTRNLGIRYLWSQFSSPAYHFMLLIRCLLVDSLCIVQDSPSDWEEEAPKMSEMYGNSYLTIAAFVAVDAKSGFLNDRMAKFLPKVLNGNGLRCRSEIDHVSWPALEPMVTRAWCYQERLVPRRVLSYRVAEVTWECRSTHWCECGRAESYSGADRITYERRLLGHKLDEKMMYDYWHQKLIVEYTKLSLTRETDRLAAISALADQFKERLKIVGIENTLVAGLWSNRILESLTWRCLGRPGRGSGGKALVGRAHVAYQAPSWSWASIEGPINCEKLHMESGGNYHIAEVLNFPKTLAQSPQDNCLTIRGRIMKAQLDISSGGYTLRRRARAQTWMDSVVVGYAIHDDHTIPHYPNFHPKIRSYGTNPGRQWCE
jgi:hypothetical protein